MRLSVFVLYRQIVFALFMIVVVNCLSGVVWGHWSAEERSSC